MYVSMERVLGTVLASYSVGRTDGTNAPIRIQTARGHDKRYKHTSDCTDRSVLVYTYTTTRHRTQACSGYAKRIHLPKDTENSETRHRRREWRAYRTHVVDRHTCTCRHLFQRERCSNVRTKRHSTLGCSGLLEMHCDRIGAPRDAL